MSQDDKIQIKMEEKIDKEKKSKLNMLLSGITIEPMTVLWSLGNNIISIPQDQMLLYKTCIQPKYNLRYQY